MASSPFANLTPAQKMLRRVQSHGGLLAGSTIMLLLLSVALAAPLLAPHDPYSQNLSLRLIDPVWSGKGDWSYPLGTDPLGRCYLSRLIYGTRLSLAIGFFAMLVSGAIGCALGISAGYFGGRIDAVISFLLMIRLSMPVVLVALAVVSIAGTSLVVVILVLGLLIWDRFAVVMRSSTQQIRNRDFVTAAQALGCSRLRIVLSEILPNLASALIVVATLEMAHAILLEAALSFLGLGVQPPTPSWGLMVSEARKFMFFKGWLIAIPGSALCVLVLAINLVGDGIRDVTAPRGRL